MRAAAYLRVSTESQVDTWSIPAQKRAFEEYCKQKGWQLAGIYSEEGVSARSDSIEKRPQLRRLLADCKNQKFDVVVVHSLDRWSRNLRVTLETFKLLADYKVAFVSITENIDYSTPEGRLFIAMIGAFAQYFSDSLSKHSSKGMKERAMSGMHNGDVPFGYRRCDNECPPDHKGKVHLVPGEAHSVKKLFEYYASGTWTLSKLAEWLNAQGFRTRNKRSLPSGNGTKESGPRLFTVYSVRWLLHNPFFTGKVSHHGKTFPGAHEALIDDTLFEQVQAKMKSASKSGASRSTSSRVYLLKGLARCVYCGFPLWSQTAGGHYTFYREAKNCHAHTDCPANGRAIRCSTVDDQMDTLVKSFVLDPAWRERILAKVSILSDHERVAKERDVVRDKLRRLGRAFVDGMVDDGEYDVQRKLLQDRLDSLVIPEAEAALDAGRILENLGPVWEQASLEEKNGLLLTMLEAVYLDLAASKSVVGIIPKPPFYTLFEALLDRSSGEARVFKLQPEEMETPLPGEGEGGNEEEILSWWRRGRVELPVQKQAIQDHYRLIRPFDLAPGALAGRVPWSQLMSLLQPLSASGLQHPDKSAPLPRSSGGSEERR